jgi:hypothetical protein
LRGRPAAFKKTVLATGGAIMALPDHLLMQRPQNAMITLLKTVLTRRVNR